MSVYSGELTKEAIAQSVLLIESAFPDLDDSYYNILKLMIKESKMSDNRLFDAVKHVIRTCVYPRPAIANFLQYDKRVKLYNYNGYMDLINKYGGVINKTYSKVEVPGVKLGMWASNSDIEMYNLIKK